jgi:hypothetical protein
MAHNYDLREIKFTKNKKPSQQNSNDKNEKKIERFFFKY